MKRYRWWHGALFYAGVQIASVVLRIAVRSLSGHGDGTAEEDRAYYRSEKLPVFAPPAALFPIAWGINNLTSIAGRLHVKNLPEETPGRREFLRIQSLSWKLFSSFNAGYFGLRSPINAALITIGYSATTAASLAIALGRMRDRRAALSLLPTALWLTLALPLAITQAMWNRDYFWKVGPVYDPPEGWAKLRPSRRSLPQP